MSSKLKNLNLNITSSDIDLTGSSPIEMLDLLKIELTAEADMKFVQQLVAFITSQTDPATVLADELAEKINKSLGIKKC